MNLFHKVRQLAIHFRTLLNENKNRIKIKLFPRKKLWMQTVELQTFFFPGTRTNASHENSGTRSSFAV